MHQHLWMCINGLRARLPACISTLTKNWNMQYADSCDGLYLRVRIGVVVRVYTIAGGTMPSADLLLQRFMSLLSKKIEHRRGRNPRRKHTRPALQNDIYGQDDRELELVLHPLSSPNWVCSAILCRMTWLFGAIGMCPVGIVLRGCVFSGSLIWFCVHFGRTIPAIVCRTFDQMKDGCMSLWHWYACTVKISWGEWAALPTHLWSMAAEHGPPCKPRAGVASTNLPTRHRTDGVWS